MTAPGTGLSGRSVLLRLAEQMDHLSRQVDDLHGLAPIEQEHLARIPLGGGLYHQVRGLRDRHEVPSRLGMGHRDGATRENLLADAELEAAGLRIHVLGGLMEGPGTVKIQKMVAGRKGYVCNAAQELMVLHIPSGSIRIEAKQRLGTDADRSHWIEADITTTTIDETFDLWHDRAVFHFLTKPQDRAAYMRVLRRALDLNGHAIIATFAEDGPTHCSGLQVVRYSPESLLAELGAGFELIETRRELHQTPAGREQRFVYCLFRRAVTKP